jgi:hypothetical protein
VICGGFVYRVVKAHDAVNNGIFAVQTQVYESGLRHGDIMRLD